MTTEYKFANAPAVKATLDTFIDLVADSLANGRAVSLRGFGRFYLKDLKGRVNKMPNGEEAVIPPRRRVRFLQGRPLKQWLDEGGPGEAGWIRQTGGPGSRA